MAWILLGVGGVAAANYVVDAISETIIKPIDNYIHEYKEEKALKLQEDNKSYLINTMKQRKKREIITNKVSKNIKIINYNHPCSLIFVNVQRTKNDQVAIDLVIEDADRWIKKFQWVTLQPYETLELLPIEIESYKIILHYRYYQVLQLHKDVEIKKL